MNQLLLEHGASNLFHIPDGLKELMSDITREVLRAQPKRIFDFVSNYLSVLLITRENSIISNKLLEDLCDCKPMLIDHLLEIGVTKSQSKDIAELIQDELETEIPIPGRENMQEVFIMKRVVENFTYPPEITAKICKIIQNAYRDYWYRKQALDKSLIIDEKQPWKLAVKNALDIFRTTKPSASELRRAEEKVEAAYKSYYSHRNLLRHLMKKKLKPASEKVRDEDKNNLTVVSHHLDTNFELGSIMCIDSGQNFADDKKLSQITGILNDEEDYAPPATKETKETKETKDQKPKKTFKFSPESTEDVPSYYTEVKITPKLGTQTTQTQTTDVSMTQAVATTPLSPITDIAKDVLGSLDDVMDDIPENINVIDELSDIDVFDIPEVLSDTVSGSSTSAVAGNSSDDEVQEE